MIERAICKLYSNVAVIHNDGQGSVDAYDEAGNAITLDMAQVNTEAALEELRDERNQRLAATDWWAGSDHTMTQAQTDYRQALRDITDNATSLDDVTWPTKP